MASPELRSMSCESTGSAGFLVNDGIATQGQTEISTFESRDVITIGIVSQTGSRRCHGNIESGAIF
jgi:hypothetical protein